MILISWISGCWSFSEWDVWFSNWHYCISVRKSKLMIFVFEIFYWMCDFFQTLCFYVHVKCSNFFYQIFTSYYTLVICCIVKMLVYWHWQELEAVELSKFQLVSWYSSLYLVCPQFFNRISHKSPYLFIFYSCFKMLPKMVIFTRKMWSPFCIYSHANHSSSLLHLIWLCLYVSPPHCHRWPFLCVVCICITLVFNQCHLQHLLVLVFYSSVTWTVSEQNLYWGSLSSWEFQYHNTSENIGWGIFTVVLDGWEH